MPEEIFIINSLGFVVLKSLINDMDKHIKLQLPKLAYGIYFVRIKNKYHYSIGK